MKATKLVHLLIAVLGVAIIFCQIGCASAPPRRTPPPRTLAADVVAEFERSVAGWNAGRLDQFMAIYAEDATFSMKESFLQGYAAIRNYYAPQFVPGAERPSLVLEEFHVEVLSLDVVLVRGVYRNSLNLQVLGRGTTSLILRHMDGHWRIIHDHSS